MKGKKKYLLFFIVCFFVMCNGVQATTLRDLYNDLKALENNYAAAQKKANLTKAEMSKIKANIASAEAEITRAQNEIIQAEKDIINSQKEIDKKKDETDQMLLYLQVTGSKGNSMLEYIFEAEDYTDFIYRYSVVTQMSEYNQGLVEELNVLIDNLNNKKQQLSDKQKELSKKKNELQGQYMIVQAQYKDEHDDGMDIKSEISQLNKRINSYKSICKMDQDINTCGGFAAVDGWFYPLKHFYQTSVYEEVRGSKKHYAVDLGVAEETPVYAVANGKVISVYSSTCGGLVIQIQHNYNGSSYVSLYMHLIDGYVKLNQTVTGGQKIGTSGGGKKEIAKWGDVCTEGAHLHFAMATGSSAIGSSSKKGSTFNPVRFFPAMTGYGARL